MNDLILAFQKSLKSSDMAGPLIIIAILAMMILPLPPILLDLFFTFNIGVSLLVLLTAMKSQRALDFLSFPTVLLMTTLLRLSLNVASTRAVLLEGHTGPDAAGKVIESFAQFLIGGNYAVGIVVFMVLTIINFVVITKGATRIAEVAARFTLDAMPGKQMAIDADLNAGVIKDDEAKKRRAEVSQEAEFYGSMDGASKFVRGDAIAAILILAINLIGGLIIGVTQHGLDIVTAASNYTLLAIGDGLVAQVPGIMISTAAGLMVSRVSAGEAVSTQIAKNMLSDYRNIYMAAGIVAILGLIPGMPHLSFIFISGAIASIGYFVKNKSSANELDADISQKLEAKREEPEVSWADAPAPDLIAIEIGYRLLPMTQMSNDQDLLKRVKGVRKKFTQDYGFLPATIQIRDNLELSPNNYKILFKGVEVGAGDVYPDKLMAIHGENESLSPLPGEKTQDPAFGMPAVWISQDAKRQAEFAGYAVVDPGTVIATHLSHIMKIHASELMGREETQALIENLKTYAPGLVEAIVPKIVPVGVIQKIMQMLLSEDLPVSDTRSILETLAENYGVSQDNGELYKLVRQSMARAIAFKIAGNETTIEAMALSPKLEGMLLQAFSSGGAFDPKMAETLMIEVSQKSDEIEIDGGTPVLVVPAQIRTSMAKFLRKTAKQLNVVSLDEIPDGRRVKVSYLIGS